MTFKKNNYRSIKCLLITLFFLLSITTHTVVNVATASNETGKVHTIKVVELAVAPVLDGNLDDWPSFDNQQWQRFQVLPALKDDPKNLTGTSEVFLAVGIFGERIFLAARWPDSSADTKYKTWQWQNKQYKRGEQRDDMFAIRFLLDGTYNACMLPEKLPEKLPENDATYKMDVWLWSAGRSNLASLAEDMVHTISDQFMEDSAEYPLAHNRTIYIKKRRDSGDSFFGNTRPDRKIFQGQTLPGVILNGAGSESLVDVSATGHWKKGYWLLEMSRKLVTGHADDVAFLPGRIIPGGIAVFNKGSAEHKSVAGNLLFDLSYIK